jgi:hypothetical protein
MPARGGEKEICGVFVLAKGKLWLEAIDAAARGLQQRKDVAAIFAIVALCNLFPHGAIRDLLRGALQDYRFIRLFGGDDTVRLGPDVFRFAGARPGAEPESLFTPDTPHHHQMGPSVRARGGDPIVVRFLETIQRPRPWLETRRGIGRSLQRVGPIGAACSWFFHTGSLGELAIGWILAVFANDARADFYDGNPEMRTGAPSSSPGQQKSLVGNEEASDAALTRRAADGKPAGNQETKAQPMR